MSVMPKYTEPVRTGYAYGSPTIQPVSLAQTKAHLKVDHSDEDDLIEALIDTAVAHFEGYDGVLGQCLLTQTVTVSYDRFGGDAKLRIPVSPLQSVVVSYYDTDNVQQTYAAANYALHTDSIGPYITRVSGIGAYPAAYERDDAVTITCTAGYGDTVADIPAPIISALLLLIGHLYENREQVTTGQLSNLPMGIDTLLFQYRRHSFGNV